MRGTRFVKAALIAAAGSGIFWGSQASATLTVSLVRTPVSQAARDADPANLGSKFPRTFDLLVTEGAPGENWAYGTILMTLNTGSMSGNTGTFYSSPTNDDFQNLVAESLNAANAFDTYVTTPDGPNGAAGSSTILGKSDYPIPGDGLGKMPGIVAGRSSALDPAASNTQIDITWGDFNPAAGTAQQANARIARITILGKAGGEIVGHVGGSLNDANDPGVLYNAVVPVYGDMNLDGTTDNFDIPQFVAAINNPAQYLANTGVNPIWNGDTNDDGVIDNFDIPSFVGLINFAGGDSIPADQLASLMAMVPEPASATLGLLGLAVLARRRRV